MHTPVPLATLFSIMLLVPSTLVDDTRFAEPAAGWTTAAKNLPASDTSVHVASKRNGDGDITTLDPGASTNRDTDSVYIHWVGQREQGVVCVTYLNGQLRSEQGWVNTAWWRRIHVQVECWR